MAGLGLLLSGLSGAGRGVAASAEQDQRLANEQALADQRARLEEEKLLRIDEVRRGRERQAGVQQGQDIGAETDRLQNQRDAEAINAKYGSNATAEDVQSLRSNPEARQAYGLLASTRQGGLEDRATAAENLGYLDAARETRGALQTEIQDQRQEAQHKSNERRLDQQDERQKALDKYNQRREDRLDRLAESQLAFQKARAGKSDAQAEQSAAREQRAATAAALKGAESDIRGLQKELADPLLAEQQKTVLQDQLNVARSDARRFRSALSSAGLEGSEAPSKPFNPADYSLGGGSSGGGNTPNAKRTPNPFSDSGTPAKATESEPRRTPEELARNGLDRAINDTVRALTAASNRGDAGETQRLNDLLQEQQRARSRL